MEWAFGYLNAYASCTFLNGIGRRHIVVTKALKGHGDFKKNVG